MCKRACLLKSKLAGGKISEQDWDYHNFLWAYYQMMLKNYMCPLEYKPPVPGVDAYFTFMYDVTISEISGEPYPQFSLFIPHIGLSFATVGILGNTPAQNLQLLVDEFNLNYQTLTGLYMTADFGALTVTVHAPVGTYGLYNGESAVTVFTVAPGVERPRSYIFYFGHGPIMYGMLTEEQAENFDSFAYAMNGHLGLCVEPVDKLPNFGSCNNLNIVQDVNPG